MKRILAATLAGLTLSLSFLSDATASGRHHRGHGPGSRVEGALAGLAAGFVFGLLVGAARADAPVPAQGGPVYGDPGAPPPRWIPGNWETRWIPTVVRLDVSVPGYHDTHGNWIPAHLQTQAIQSDAWTQVWMPGHWE